MPRADVNVDDVGGGTSRGKTVSGADSCLAGDGTDGT